MGVVEVYLFWKHNALGSIAISQEGAVEFVNSFLEPPYTCTHVALSSREDCLFPVMVFPHGSSGAEMGVFEARVRAGLKEMGLDTRISWTEVKSDTTEHRGREHCGKLCSFLPYIHRPTFWGIFGAGASVLVTGGMKSLLWGLLWGGLLYFGATFLLSQRGKRFVRKVRSMVGR